MPLKYDNLFDDISGFQPLISAAKRAVKGKRHKPGAAMFMANLETAVLQLERELRDRCYVPGPYSEFTVTDAKTRNISAAPFRDRVVHHALCGVLEPIFERGFVYDSYANRQGKGSHRAVDRYEKFRDRFAYVLRCDIYRYFPAIDHALLKADLRRRITCDSTLWLADLIVDRSNKQEPVDLHYPGDDLLAPLTRRRGLPIGNLSSQFFGNLYLDGMDHFCREVLSARGYVRYVDDFALFHDDPEILDQWRQRLASFLALRRLSLHPRKTQIIATNEPTRFLGYELLPDGRRRLPEENIRRFRGRLRSMRDRWRAGTIEIADVKQRVNAWISHAEHADTWRLRHAVFEGRMFDPFLDNCFRDGGFSPKRKPVRPSHAARSARRLLEQQTQERAIRKPQQEPIRKPEQQ